MNEQARETSYGLSRGYYGHGVVKPPVWTWQVPLYFFVGGLAGMTAVVAFAAMLIGHASLATAGLWLAVVGAIAGAGLLTWDLGRPARFFVMLRILKLRSPMSIGSWLLSAFGAGAAATLLVVLIWGHGTAALILGAGAALLGSVVATYTGVLIGATVIPAWHRHRIALPITFGVSGLGASAALLEILGFRVITLHWIGLGAAAIETGLALWHEIRTHPVIDRPLRDGVSGGLLRFSGVMSALALILRITNLVLPAAVAFLIGALVRRYGWLQVGRASARDPSAAFAADRDS